MLTIVSQLEHAFRTAIADAFGVEADPLLNVAQNEKFGDYQSNAAMGLSKILTETTGQKTNPRAVAEQIIAKLDLKGMASDVSIAGPGFINVRLAPAWLAGQLQEICYDERLGISETDHKQTVVVDYSGPNIAKQMHVGHLRSTIIGDAIARTLQFAGHDVIRQNHIGDWGTQFGKVVLALWYAVMAEENKLREILNAQTRAWKAAAEARDDVSKARIVSEFAGYDQRFLHDDRDGVALENRLDKFDIDLVQLEGLYQFVTAITEFPSAEAHLIYNPVREEWNPLAAIPRRITLFIQDNKNPQNRSEALAWEKARDITLTTCDAIYRDLGVQLAEPNVQKQALVRGESEYRDDLRNVVEELKAKGVAKESEGAVAVFSEGFENPLLIEKSDGGFLYGTTDLAAIRYRVEKLRAKRIIYTHDSRQSQHFAQVFDAARRAGWANGVQLDYAPFGTMLGEDGKPFKTRSGDTVKLKDLLVEAEKRALDIVRQKNAERPEDLRLPEQSLQVVAHSVGIGAVKYSDLSKDRTSDYMFSWDKMLSFEGNTAPYMQYAYARISSIFRKAGGSGAIAADAKMILDSPFEQSLAKHILRAQEIIALVGRELKPHYLCTYLYELAGKFSSFYENCDVLKSEEPTRSSRLLLIDITRRTLALGLNLLGIKHPEQM